MVRMTIFKKSGEDVEKRGSSHTVNGNVNSYATESSMEVPQKAKRRTST